METFTETDKEQILRDNLEHTLFSWSKQAGLNPINAERAEGVYLWDRDGKRYIDFSSQLMNVNIGHGNQKVTEAVAAQMRELSYVYPGMITKARGDLGKRLAEITAPNLTKAFFTLGGAEAIENAIKLARIYTGRHKIVSLYQSFHGASYGAISVGGDPRKFAVDSQAMPGTVHVENPYFYRCPWYSTTPEECAERAAAAMERIIGYENPGSVAAIILEGESGTSGCIKYPPGYWKLVREICDKHGILLIADEVMSGFGRTGKWFGSDHHGVKVDLMCMAKGITAGYLPLGAVMVDDKIAHYFDERALPLGLTYSAHPVSCAAAVAVLDIYEEENMLENVRELGHYLDARICDLMAEHPSIGDWRNTGLFGCLELVKNRDTKEPMAPWNAAPDQMAVMNQVAAKIRELGMYTFVRWNYIFIAPPLNITKDELDEGLAIISEAIRIADQHVH
ncbi:aminotransferase class III-fold pyridoxal phosphate-dependent enzyme [Hymenobacter sp. 15J16-1T3B]|uniref:aminotransferase class III-fold pyridoxal phosphate-dependent enzyme n=1 Tax=Hymenobacter sp. 15J16-1T3B TaxID=2886941 RepID=UPI001D12DE91|nr:aminotransferase class III-fold pyridoxal phosphate-dependent enzyme [Hymenobacter sp. 15J16-1T3B]MCC3160695.1 aminotransferase class III-fold pyridoxal phosphate-dependent enzyme [Hymenobacter sp. 15J16-1T3B]